MIESIKFTNYRILRDAVLPLRPFTVVVGPNGSGKSTIMHALRSAGTFRIGRTPTSRIGLREVVSLSDSVLPDAVEIGIEWSDALGGTTSSFIWSPTSSTMHHLLPTGETAYSKLVGFVMGFIYGIKIYSLNEQAIATPADLEPGVKLREDGGNLPAVLDRLRDQSPEMFEALNTEISHLLPEFDRILFETPSTGKRGFMLRLRKGLHPIHAANLSQGTLLALAILTLAYLPEPPSMVCIEEPDRGIHPRLYRDIRDALYRLAYPESFGLDRKPVQVLITTHSPYLLDLHKDHPEEVVIAQKTEDGATFQRLIDREDLAELLEEASLGEIWYSGVLGGVPTWR